MFCYNTPKASLMKIILVLSLKSIGLSIGVCIVNMGLIITIIILLGFGYICFLHSGLCLLLKPYKLENTF